MKKTRHPRVTTVLSEMLDNSWLFKWRAKVGAEEANRIARESASVGTTVHYRVLNKLIKANLPLPEVNFKDLPKNINHLCEISEIQWDDLIDTQFKIHPGRIDVEVNRVDHDLKFTGTYDLAANVSFGDDKPKWTIIDLKTSAMARESHFIQLGAYSILCDTKPQQAAVITLCPYVQKNPDLQGKIYILEKDELELRKNQFLELLEGYHKKQEKKSVRKTTKKLKNIKNPERV